MKEIGGYLEFENLISKHYYPDAIKLNTARNALAYLSRAKGIKKVYIPYFLCDSVVNVCKRDNIEYEFYHVDEKFRPAFEGQFACDEYLYIVNYYGQIDNHAIREYKSKYKNIIVDNVQSFYSKPIEGVDTIYSCRKFFGVPDGAYLITNADDILLAKDSSVDRMKHILGRYESGRASDYYAFFSENERLIDTLPLLAMSQTTKNILGAIDYKSVEDKRNSNWETLNKNLSQYNYISPVRGNGPYAYPLYFSGANALRKPLAERGVYIPTLWKNVLEYDSNEIEQSYALDILPLPVDQRYTAEDMERIVEEIISLI